MTARRISIAAAMVALLCAAPASGYVIIYDNFQNPMTWNKSTVGWSLAANGSDDVPLAEAQGALQAAFDSWENIGCATIGFNYGGAVSANPNKDIFVRWLEQNWDLTVQDAVGVTTNWKLNPGGGINKVEIFFNGASATWATSGSDDPFSSTVDIQAVATHEIGHAIGMDHPRHRTSTMWFTTFPGESEAQRSLEDDDKRGACFLYPATNFSSGQACDVCWSHNNCASGSCIDFGAEGPFCGQDCNTTSNCPTGFFCAALQGGVKQCLPNNDHCAPTGGNIGTGEFCYDHATCSSGRCLVLPDTALCTENCNPEGGGNGGCPSSMVCIGQSPNAICYPKGSGALGDDCLSPADCATLDCIGIGSGKGVCTQPCASDAQCPGGLKCVADFCVETGSAGFGDSCEYLTDCASGLCVPFAQYCSQPCDTEADCPGGVECINGAYCDPGATGVTGDTCGPGAKECVAGLFCLYSSKEAALGTCREKCDVRYDGCSGGQFCDWVWQDWAAKVVGVCVGDNGGVGLGASCGGSTSCKPDMVCADTDGTGAKCRQDCNAKNTLGCSAGASCVALNLADDPKLGACHPKDAPPPVEAPVVVEATRNPEPPPTVVEDDGPVGDDLGGGPGAEAGPIPLGDQGGGTTGSTGSESSGRRGGGGCSATPARGAHHGAWWLLGGLLALLAARRRRATV